MLEYIYICRHGFRSNWVDPSIKTSPTGMSRDPPLAAYGEAQAERLAAFLSSAETLSPYPVPERVFSSPFYRCIQTAAPAAKVLGNKGVCLEHGVMEWQVWLWLLGFCWADKAAQVLNRQTIVRPAPATVLSIDHVNLLSRFDRYIDRADLLVESWTSRVEEMGYTSVVIFAHAASVIALGRALTGDKTLHVSAGCASTSLYKRKSPEPHPSPPPTTPSETKKMGNHAGAGRHADVAGVGEWEIVWNGKADYLVNGVERDWSFRDVEINDGEVILDNGDQRPHQPDDELPVGLADGMEKYLRRGRPSPNSRAVDLDIIANKGKM
ncbi:transcription factor C subunit 7, partial [Tremellales sp. Uapishka_1]